MDKIDTLQNSQLFYGIHPNELSSILKNIPLTSHKKNHFIFMTGEVAECIFVIKSGTVKVSYVDMNGQEKILNIFQTGDVFGNLFLGKYRFRIGYAQAINKVQVYRLGEQDFIQLIEQYPKIATNYIRYQADEHRETIARMHALMSMDAKHRVLGILLSLVRRYCCDYGDSYLLPASLTQADLANMTGLNRSTVSLIINELRRDGILGGSGRSLSVNKSALEEVLADIGSEILS